MQSYDGYIERTQDFLQKKNYYSSLDSFVYWDMQQHMPPAGRAYGGELRRFIAAQSQELTQSAELRRLAEYFRLLEPEDYACDRDRALGRIVVREYDSHCRLPAELALRLHTARQEADEAFRQAKEHSDFSLLRDRLKVYFDLKKEAALRSFPDRDPFETMIDGFDEGMKLSDAVRLLEELRCGVTDLLARIRACPPIDTSALQCSFDKSALEHAVKDMLRKLGLEPDGSAFGNMPHPQCAMLGPRDVRPALNFDWGLLSVISSIHEAGHGMYNYGSAEELISCGLWGGQHGFMHEGHARFYENMIGRSPEFWEWFYPAFRETAPELRAVPLEKFYRAMHAVTPSLIRISADELTYSLHIIIRFELERDYFAGRLGIDELPEAWNAKYENYLGISPSCDHEGILQEGHWIAGFVGYFQSYALGNLWGGQLLHALRLEEPEVFEHIRMGNFAPLNNWMTERVARHGKVYSPPELVRRATGEELQAGYFIDYLREKYSRIYGFEY